MAEMIALTARNRAGSGKGEARALRRQGRVPAVAYGADLSDPLAVSVDARELYRALHTDAGANAIFELRLDGEIQLAMAREIQRHPVRREVVHVDFVTVSRDVKVRVDVPIVLVGEAPGAEEGGVVEQQLHNLPVEVLPLEVPDQITLDISDMQIGDTKRVADLQTPAGVEVLEDAERTIVTVVLPQLEVPEPDLEAPLEALEGAEAVAEQGADAPAEAEAGEGAEAGDTEE